MENVLDCGKLAENLSVGDSHFLFTSQNLASSGLYGGEICPLPAGTLYRPSLIIGIMLSSKKNYGLTWGVISIGSLENLNRTYTAYKREPIALRLYMRHYKANRLRLQIEPTGNRITLQREYKRSRMRTNTRKGT